MIKFIDLTFHANNEYGDSDALIRAQQVALLYIQPVAGRLDVEVIKHIDNAGTKINPRQGFTFFRGKNGFFRIPLETLHYLRKQKPDIIFVRGLGFPLQVLALRWWLGRRVKIFVKHHADRPGSGLKRIMQRIADRCIDVYFFASKENAREWHDLEIIPDKTKIFEQPATFTSFAPLDKDVCRAQLAWNHGPVFLWVGRLNHNKDPFTVLQAFKKLLGAAPSAQLYLVYKTAELLPEVSAFIEKDMQLKNAVFLCGHLEHNELPVMYSAADFFISSSHSEGGSVAILEGMASGCIPIVSQIPSSMKTIGDGKFGFFFRAGDPDMLYLAMSEALAVDRPGFSAKVASYFSQSLSLPAVSDQLVALCHQLAGG